MTLTAALIEAFAPSGVLRASINLGNPILANADATSGRPVGVSIDLANAFGEWLGVAVELRVFDAAGKSVDAVVNDRADIGFFAIDPVRGAGIAFTAPYLLIEGAYLVRAESPLTQNEQVDAAGLRVVVGQGSAYDLFLTRELKQAQIVRAPTSPSVVEVFLEQAADVAAGVKQPLEADARKRGRLRLLPGRFMIIQQAMGTPKAKGEAAASALHRFVEDMKRSGFVAESLRRHRIEGATVAPVAP